jgi:hypothetical protein
MMSLQVSRVLVLFLYILSAQCGYIVPVSNSIDGDQGYSYPNVATEISDNLTAVRVETDNESERLSTQDRTQAASGGYWLGDESLHHFSKVSSFQIDTR